MVIGTGLEAYIQFINGTSATQVKPKEYLVGYITAGVSLQDLLNGYSLTIPAGELPVLTFSKYEPASNAYIVQKYLLMKPSGATYAPMGPGITDKDLILIDTIYPNEQTVQSAFQAVNAVVFDSFEIDSLSDLLDYLNTSVAPYDCSDETKIYYFRFTTPDSSCVYVLSENALRGVYGAGELQFVEGDLVRFFDNSRDAISTQALLKSEQGELVITSEADVHNLVIEGQNAISFTNSISFSGIDTTNLYDGQIIRVRNNSDGLVFLRHNSVESAEGNRLFIVGGVDLSLLQHSWAELRVSKLRNRVEIINVYGTDYFPSLVNNSGRNRVMLFTPEGIATFEETAEYMVFDEGTGGYNSLSAINTAYPSSAGYLKGFTVVCGFTTPPSIFYKLGDSDAHWLKHSTAGLVKLT